MSTQTELEQVTAEDIDTPWTVLLWDDPVNEMQYVTYVLTQVFAFDSERAARVMLEAHTNGKAPVWSGERHEAEGKVSMLHQWKLQASLTKD